MKKQIQSQQSNTQKKDKAKFYEQAIKPKQSKQGDSINMSVSLPRKASMKSRKKAQKQKRAELNQPYSIYGSLKNSSSKRRDSLDDILYDKTQRMMNEEKQLKQTLNSLEKRVQQINLDLQCKLEPTMVLEKVLQAERKAKEYKMKDLEKKANKILGRLLLKIEIYNYRSAIQTKIAKKEKMEEDFFRQIRIKKFDYQDLVVQKLKQNSYIVVPYSSGKGFIESDNYYNQFEGPHRARLLQCDYSAVVRTVNQIFMQNYSYCSAQSSKGFQSGGLFTSAIFLGVIFTILGIMLIMKQEWKEWLINSMIGLLTVIVGIIIFLALQTFTDKPNSNNHMQQTIEDVHNLFNHINEENRKKGKKKYIWSFPQSFMYLQVRFDLTEVSPEQPMEMTSYEQMKNNRSEAESVREVFKKAII